LANTPEGTLDKKDVATQEAFAMMLATQDTMDPAIARLGGTSSPRRRAQVLLKARRERAAETGQRVRERVAHSSSVGDGSNEGGGGGKVATNEPGNGTLELGSNTQGGDGDSAGTKKAKGKSHGKRGERSEEGKRQRKGQEEEAR
jgi:hypothetical protein